MRILFTPIKIENILIAAAKNRKVIEENLTEASEYDNKSARYLKKGNYEKAAYYAILSQEHLRIASQAKIEDIKLHALYN
jgi:hypothetical protein